MNTDRYYIKNKNELVLITNKERKNKGKTLKIIMRLLYKKKVKELTEIQPLHILENYNLRGYKNFHVDHIVSIFDGYYNMIPVEFIGDISNLQMLPYKENRLKCTKSDSNALQTMIDKVKTLRNY